MTTRNDYDSLAEAFARRRQEVLDELARLDKAMAILGASGTGAAIETAFEPFSIARRRKPKTIRDWVARAAKKVDRITPDAVLAAAAERGRELNRRTVVVELSTMKRKGLLRKVPKGYALAA